MAGIVYISSSKRFVLHRYRDISVTYLHYTQHKHAAFGYYLALDEYGIQPVIVIETKATAYDGSRLLPFPSVLSHVKNQ